MSLHINAKENAFAPVVLMPGDPLRAKWIAKTFLTDVVEVCNLRGMLGYTGYYKNHKISVMGHGMGVPSICIYAQELFDSYGVKCIIRVGSCGSYVPEFNIGDIIIVDRACSISSIQEQLGFKKEENEFSPSKVGFQCAQDAAQELKMKTIHGKAYSGDIFYSTINYVEMYKRTSAVCVDMEAFGLFALAKKLNKDSCCIMTCSDSFITKKEIDPAKRQNTFNPMAELGLQTAINYLKQLG